MDGWTDDTVGGIGRQNDTKRIRKFGRGREEKGGKLADGRTPRKPRRTDGRVGNSEEGRARRARARARGKGFLLCVPDAATLFSRLSRMCRSGSTFHIFSK